MSKEKKDYIKKVRKTTEVNIHVDINFNSTPAQSRNSLSGAGLMAALMSDDIPTLFKSLRKSSPSQAARVTNIELIEKWAKSNLDYAKSRHEKESAEGGDESKSTLWSMRIDQYERFAEAVERLKADENATQVYEDTERTLRASGAKSKGTEEEKKLEDSFPDAVFKD